MAADGGKRFMFFTEHEARPVVAADQHPTGTAYARFNARVATVVTSRTGTMTTAYLFALVALVGLPAALSPSGIGVVAWFSSVFAQFVLLPIILVGSNLLARAGDARSVEAFEASKAILLHLDAIDARLDALGAPPVAPAAP